MRQCVKSCLVSRTGIEGVAVPLRGKKARLPLSVRDCKRPSLSGGLEHMRHPVWGLGNPSAVLAHLSVAATALVHHASRMVYCLREGSQALLDSN